MSNCKCGLADILITFDQHEALQLGLCNVLYRDRYLKLSATLSAGNKKLGIETERELFPIFNFNYWEIIKAIYTAINNGHAQEKWFDESIINPEYRKIADI